MKKINSLGMLIQIILIGAIFVLTICSIFIPIMKIVAELLVVLLLFIMAYNNFRIYKRKGFTWIYALGGLIFLGIIYMEYWNGK